MQHFVQITPIDQLSNMQRRLSINYRVYGCAIKFRARPLQMLSPGKSCKLFVAAVANSFDAILSFCCRCPRNRPRLCTGEPSWFFRTVRQHVCDMKESSHVKSASNSGVWVRVCVCRALVAQVRAASWVLQLRLVIPSAKCTKKFISFWLLLLS